MRIERTGWVATFLYLAAVFVIVSRVEAAETGDFDGDGALTIRDVLHVMIPLIDDDPHPDVPIAEGSLELFEEYPCVEYEDGFYTRRTWWPASVYLEILRRSVPDGYAVYSPMHWIEDWALAVPQAPLAPDPRFSVRVLPSEHDPAIDGIDGDKVRVELEVSIEARVRAFSLILETDDGLLRVPWFSHDYWTPYRWADTWSIFDLRERHSDGELEVAVPVIAYLITAGRYVVAHGLRRKDDPVVIPPGKYRIITRGRLPLGTSPGKYRLELLETSQVLFEDGTVASPTIEEQGEIRIANKVEVGWDEGVPPLRFDEVERRVLGEVHFRFADANGNPVPPGEPIARGAPLDHVKFRVQMRTETPLNYIHLLFHGPAGTLVCGEETRSLLDDFGLPGEPLPMGWPPSWACQDRSVSRYQGWYYLGCNHAPTGELPGANRDVLVTAYRDRAWEYLKPLGQWLDLMEFDLQISDAAEGDLELRFHRPDPSDPGGGPFLDGNVEFAPYLSRKFCFREAHQDQFPSPNWKYDVIYEDGFIAVDDPSEPPVPPDLGIKFEIGEAEGFPGDLVEVPVVLSWRAPVVLLRLVLEMDPDAIVVESVDTSHRAVRTEDDVRYVRLITQRGEINQYRECMPGCVPGGAIPCCWLGQGFTNFRDSDERFTVIDWLGFATRVETKPLEIARLRVRIQEGADVNLAELRPSLVRLEQDGIETDFESGGWGIEPFFAPAEVTPGRARILSGGRSFRRGDVESDSVLRITDAVVLLNYLFLGGRAPPCYDAADANDDGNMDITDPITILEHLFQGGRRLPDPFDDCGPDPTVDDLGCASFPACS